MHHPGEHGSQWEAIGPIAAKIGWHGPQSAAELDLRRFFRLCHKHVRPYERISGSHEDAVQVAVVGLLKARDRRGASRDPFSTLASLLIKAELSAEAKVQRRDGVLQRERKSGRAAIKNGRVYDLRPHEEVRVRVVSANQVGEDGEELDLFDTIPSGDLDPEQRLLAEEEARPLPARVAEAVARLSREDREFVRRLIADTAPDGRRVTPESAWARVRREERRHARLRRAFRELRPQLAPRHWVLGQHVNRSLAKPSVGERLIFVDLNVPQKLDDRGKPVWVEPAMRRLERLERENLPGGVTAYVFVTNVAFHRELDTNAAIAAAPIGLGMPEFARPGVVGVVDAYKAKQKHIDAHEIGAGFEQYTAFPTTFDGSLPSEAFGQTPGRVLIGETYEFDDGPGTVTSATVVEQQKEMYLTVTGPDGKGRILRAPMSEAELADYRAHPDAYFGQIVRPTVKSEDPLDWFELMVDVYKDTPREKLIEWMSGAVNRARLDALSHEELVMRFAEITVGSMLRSRERTPKTQTDRPGSP